MGVMSCKNRYFEFMSFIFPYQKENVKLKNHSTHYFMKLGFKQLFLLVSTLVLFACNEPATRTGPPADPNIKVHPPASPEAHLFFNWWLGSQKTPVFLNDQLRNKLLNKTDAAELEKYFKRNGLSMKVFPGVLDSIKLMEYKSFNRNLIKSGVKWIDQNRLRGCRKISKEAMWDCLRQDYGATDYYYVSSPIFSTDKNWVLVSINYMESKGEMSKGAGRLFKRLKGNTWEEVALLSYWGNFEE